MIELFTVFRLNGPKGRFLVQCFTSHIWAEHYPTPYNSPKKMKAPLFTVQRAVENFCFWNWCRNYVSIWRFAASPAVVPRPPLSKDTPCLDFSTTGNVGLDQNHVTNILVMEIPNCASVKTSRDVTSMTKASALERETPISCTSCWKVRTYKVKGNRALLYCLCD